MVNFEKKKCPGPGSIPCEPGRWTQVLSTLKNQNCSLWTSRVSKYPVGSHGKFLGPRGQFWEKSLSRASSFSLLTWKVDLVPVNYEKSNLFPANLLWIQVTCWVPRLVLRSGLSILRNKNKTKKVCLKPGSLPCEPGRRTQVLSTLKTWGEKKSLSGASSSSLWTWLTVQGPVGS